MSWVFLAIAIAGDVAGTAVLERASRSDPRRRYFLPAAAAYLLAVYTFAQALQTIPTSIADAIFFAGTATLVTVYSVTWLGERLTTRKTIGLILVVGGVVALRLDAAHGVSRHPRDRAAQAPWALSSAGPRSTRRSPWTSRMCSPSTTPTA